MLITKEEMTARIQEAISDTDELIAKEKDEETKSILQEANSLFREVLS